MNEQKLLDTPAELQQKFRSLASAWKVDEGVSSSLSERFAHPAYQQIISIGEPVIPLILAELERDPDWWFAALKSITGDDPVPDASRGRLKELTRAWLDWGRKRGLRW